MQSPAPPYDADAEEAVLGAILYQPDALADVAGIVQPSDFYLAKHQQIYTAMLACQRDRTPADALLVQTRLRNSGQLDAVGGFPYLVHLTDAAPLASRAPHLARVVADHAARRRLALAAASIAEEAYATDRPLDAVLANAAAALAGATRRQDSALVSMRTIADELYEGLQTGESRVLYTGLRDLDALLGGLAPGDLTVLAGRPGHGKSALALTIADTLARGQQPVAYFSLEMRRAELAQRLIAMRTGVGAQTQRQHRYTDTELEAAIAAIGQIAELPIAVHDQRGLTVEDVRARTLRHAQAVGGVALVVVDYLTLITAEQARGTNRAQAVGEISRGLKRLAGDADAPVLALAQLNRQLDGRTGWRPTLSDLKESGDIEADADQVVFIVRPELFETDPQRQAAARGLAKLYVEKNRHGPPGRAVVQFDGVRTTLRDLAPRWRDVHGYEHDDNE